MSVINQVLQQLEQRRAPAPASTAAAPAAPLAAVPSGSSRRLMWIVGLGAAGIAAVAFGDWPSLLAKKGHLPRAVAMAADTPPAPAPAAAADAGAAPAAAAEAATPITAAAPTITAPTITGTTTATATANAGTSGPAAPPAAATAVAAAAAVSTRWAPAPARALAPPPDAETPRPAPIALPAAAPAALPNPAPLAPPLPSVRKQLADSPEQRAREFAVAAQESAQIGHRQLAIDRALQALKLDGALHGARHLAAALLAETGRTAEAEALLFEKLDDKAFPRAAALLLARLIAERGDNDGALALMDRFDLRDADALGLRGALHARLGDAPRARAAYEAAVLQKPQQASWWLGLAIALEAEQLAPRAREAYARARSIGLAEPELAAYADARLRALN